MSGNRVTLVGFAAAAEALTHAADPPLKQLWASPDCRHFSHPKGGDGAPVDDGPPGPVAAADADKANDFDSAPLPEALVEALDTQALAHIRSGSPNVDVESAPERPERVEGGWWVSMRIFVSDED